MHHEFGSALKTWRNQRRMSQLDLGLSANVSARHISFLETGRSRPSRAMVIRLCEELEVPRPARNEMLTSAGMSPAYAARDLSEAEMAPVRAAVDWMLERHAPFPAIALDRAWTVVRMNAPADALLSGMGVHEGESVITALAENEALRAAIENIDEVARHAIARLRTENAHLGADPVLIAAIEALTARHPESVERDQGLLPAFAPTRYVMGNVKFSFFSTYAQFGAAEDIALSELKIEMMFPADDETRDRLIAMFGGGADAEAD